MEESSFFNYWFTFFFALGFCFWFPMYVVKTRGKGLPDWGLACCIVLLFLFLPLLSLSFIRDVFPALWLGVENGGLDAVNTDMLSESLSQMSTLEQTFIGLSVLGIIGSMILNGFSAWMLYIRRVRRGLLTAFRLMWISAGNCCLSRGASAYSSRRSGLRFGPSECPCACRILCPLIGYHCLLKNE